jgi:heptosyltransferase-3
LGITGAECEFRFAAVPEDAQFVERHVLPDAAARYVGLFTGAGHPSRCWPLGNFAELAGRLADDGFTPVVFLGPEESEMRAAVETLFPPGVPIAEGLSIPQFIAAAARLDALITNDTGPMHLAACAGAPIVLVMHEAAPRTYLPLTSRLAVVREAAVKDITTETVLIAVGTVMASENDKSASAS